MSAFAHAETSSAPERAQSSPATERKPTPWLGAPETFSPLRVSRPDDPSEREAERIAEAVARDAPAPERVQARFENVIARKACSGCSGGTPCASCRGGDHEHEEEGVLQRSVLPNTPASRAPSHVPRWLGGGSPLPSGLQSFFGDRLGADVGSVRIHTGPAPAAAARAVSARAFTLGRDVVFGEGEYRPESAEGRKLIAHELVHTLQQSRGEIRRTITVCDPGNTPPGHTQTWGATVVGLFNELCPGITWSLDAQGQLRSADANDCTPTRIAATTTPRSCGCVCSFLSASGPHAAITHSPSENQTTSSTSVDDTFNILLTGQAYTGLTGAFRTTNPPAGGSSRQALPDPAFVILGHELCGHAGGTFVPNPATAGHERPNHEMNRDGNTSAVDIENQIRAEHTAAGGADLGIRMGDFGDPDRHTHFGSRIVMPRAMQLLTLLRELNVPIGHFFPRCTASDGNSVVYTDCAGVPAAGLRNVRMLERVVSYEDWEKHVPYLCLWKTFPAGFHFAVEGIFWHRTIAGETKATVADRWGVTLQWLNRANLLFDPVVAALTGTDQLPAGTTLVIPYKWAPGSTRYFFRRHTPSPGQPC